MPERPADWWRMLKWPTDRCRLNDPLSGGAHLNGPPTDGACLNGPPIGGAYVLSRPSSTWLIFNVNSDSPVPASPLQASRESSFSATLPGRKSCARVGIESGVPYVENTRGYSRTRVSRLALVVVRLTE